MDRQNISSGSPFEAKIGFSRAVRLGQFVFVAGTASIKDGQVWGDTAYEQTKQCLSLIEEALVRGGANLSEVVRTRIYLVDVGDQEEVGKAHQEFFGAIRPASTMVGISALVNPKMLVEVEADAIVISTIQS